MCELYVDPETLVVRRRDLLVHDSREVIRGARRHGIRRCRTSLFRPLTEVMSQQTETLPQTGLADGKGLQTVMWQPVAAKGAVLSKTTTVKGVAGDA